MTPLPKRKVSKGRRNRRRAHDAIGTPNLSQCSNCREPMRPHRVCRNCGYYKGRAVIDVKNPLLPA